jgi:hypothetical protein
LWFLAWAVVGIAAVLAIVSLGLILFVPTVALAVVIASRRAARQSVFGLATGAGAVLLYVAFVNRFGPGTTCWHRANSFGCDQHLNPLPWLILGVLLVIVGIAGYVQSSTRHAGHTPVPGPWGT